MDFTIVTPSHRQLDWLACCIASVADQEGVTVEHIVQDAGTEGFAEFVEKMRKRWPDREGYRRVMISEPDGGMYDAINKGLKRGSGRICAYLNCDEQYLPGALVKVKEGFAKHSEAEILYGGFLVVDEQGRLVTAQRPVRMFWPHVATSHLPNFTCATFFLRAMLERDQAWFDSSYRACGDTEWALARLRAGVKTGELSLFSSIFFEHPQNLGLGPDAKREHLDIRSRQNPWVSRFTGLWKILHRGQKMVRGHYCPRPLTASFYAPGNGGKTRTTQSACLSGIWSSRRAQGASLGVS